MVLIEEGLELGFMEDALESSDLGDTVAGTHREWGKEWGAKSILPCSCAWSGDNNAVAPRRLSSSQGRTGHMFLARFNFIYFGEARATARKEKVYFI